MAPIPPSPTTSAPVPMSQPPLMTLTPAAPLTPQQQPMQHMPVVPATQTPQQPAAGVVASPAQPPKRKGLEIRNPKTGEVMNKGGWTPGSGGAEPSPANSTASSVRDPSPAPAAVSETGCFFNDCLFSGVLSTTSEGAGVVGATVPQFVCALCVYEVNSWGECVD